MLINCFVSLNPSQVQWANSMLHNRSKGIRKYLFHTRLLHLALSWVAGHIPLEFLSLDAWIRWQVSIYRTKTRKTTISCMALNHWRSLHTLQQLAQGAICLRWIDKRFQYKRKLHAKWLQWTFHIVEHKMVTTLLVRFDFPLYIYPFSVL